MTGVQQQSSPQETRRQCDFQVAQKKLNEYVSICAAFFIFANKLHSAPLKRTMEGNDGAQTILFSLFSPLMGAGRLASSATKCTG